MNSPRIEQLLKFLNEDPQDTFTLYALALEYTKLKDAEAKTYYDVLLAEHQDYLPTYYHAGHYYWEGGFGERAQEIFKLGMTLALEKGDQKAHAELSNSLQNLLFEED